MAHISVPTGCARVPVWSTRMLMRARRYIPLKKQHTLESAYTPKNLSSRRNGEKKNSIT
jgi:hypothetical protein